MAICLENQKNQSGDLCDFLENIETVVIEKFKGKILSS